MMRLRNSDTELASIERLDEWQNDHLLGHPFVLVVPQVQWHPWYPVMQEKHSEFVKR